MSYANCYGGAFGALQSARRAKTPRERTAWIQAARELREVAREIRREATPEQRAEAAKIRELREVARAWNRFSEEEKRAAVEAHLAKQKA